MRKRRLRGFTLIELLVVIAIVALLISILLPALNRAKNEGQKAQCGANLREISNANAMYETDQNGDKRVPWYQSPAHNAPADPDCNYAGGLWQSLPGFLSSSPWVFGGFRSPLDPMPGDLKSDAWAYPAQIRPLNKFVDRAAVCSISDEKDRGRDIIKTFIDPGDRSYSVAFIGSTPSDEFEEARSSWQDNGSSFTLNTRFLQGYWGDSWNANMPNECDRFGTSNKKLIPHIAGGGASRFIQWMEVGFYSAAQNADWPGHPSGSQSGSPRPGWHRKFSFWQAAFADTHVSYGFFDTRQVFGLDGTIWQPNIKSSEAWPGALP